MRILQVPHPGSPFRIVPAVALAIATLFGGQVVAADAPVLTRPQKIDGAWRFEWSGLGDGWNYSIQQRTRLGGAIWLLPQSEGPWPISSTSWQQPEPIAGDQGFFRLLAVVAAERGRLMEATLLGSYTAQQLSFFFTVLEVPVTPKHGVEIRRVVYETIDPWGGRTVASGLAVCPLGTSSALPLLSYQHGTLTRTNEVPSVSAEGERWVGVAYASQGYVAALPDYLGLGSSPGFHPYHHARSEASAGIDLLRAVRSWCGDHDVALNGQVFLTGYSQGGHATMALHRDLERYHSGEFTVTASAPMAGAYDLSGVTTDDLFSGQPSEEPYYFAYLLAAYQDIYRFTNSLADLLASPYNVTLPPLLHGNTDGSDINAVMPLVAVDVLRPELRLAFQTDPDHPMRVALRDNDVHAWTPQAPMRLYHCSGDRDVPFANSEVALQEFHSRGATQVELINTVPGGDHGGCTTPSMVLALEWFNSLRD